MMVDTFAEHSHEPILTSVRTSLNLNNPNAIVDPVFALLGNAAAAQGAGKITVSYSVYRHRDSRLTVYSVQNLDCLQQAVADQAFTNAKAKSDVEVSQSSSMVLSVMLSLTILHLGYDQCSHLPCIGAQHWQSRTCERSLY